MCLRPTYNTFDKRTRIHFWICSCYRTTPSFQRFHDFANKMFCRWNEYTWHLCDTYRFRYLTISYWHFILIDASAIGFGLRYQMQLFTNKYTISQNIFVFCFSCNEYENDFCVCANECVCVCLSVNYNKYITCNRNSVCV